MGRATLRTVKALALSAVFFCVAAAAAAAATENPLALDNQGIYEKSLAALTMLFVVTVLLENAFAAIFNWRGFLAYFSRTGVKTIAMVIVSLVVVNQFDIDIVASLISAYKASTVDSGPLSKFITALILSGGSAGVYNLMHALGYRSDRRETELDARPAPDKAWLALRVIRRNAVGDVHVKIRELGSAATLPNAPAPIAGTITFRRQSLGDLLFRRPNQVSAERRIRAQAGHRVYGHRRRERCAGSHSAGARQRAVRAGTEGNR